MEIKYKRNNRNLTVFLSGELDECMASNAKSILDRVIFDNVNVGKVIFDLSGLSFMDSTGIGLLIGRYKTVTAIGGKTAIAAPSALSRRLIELAGVHKIIPVYDTAQEAVGGVA